MDTHLGEVVATLVVHGLVSPPTTQQAISHSKYAAIFLDDYFVGWVIHGSLVMGAIYY